MLAAAQTSSRHPDTAGEVSAGYSIMRDSTPLTFNGIRFSVAKNLSESWAAVVEAGREFNGGGAYPVLPGGRAIKYTDTTLLAGIRLRRFDGSSTAPFFQVLGGYFGRSNNLNTPPGKANFAVRAEGGLDVRVANHVAFRFGGGWTFLDGGVRYLNQISATAGLTYLFGKR